MPKSQGIRYRLRKDGTVRGYEVRYRDPENNGKVRGKTFKTLDQAKAWQRDNLHAIQHGTYIAPEKEATTWAAVSQEWLAGHRVKLRARSIQGYEGVLSRWLSRWDHRSIASIARKDVRDLLTDIRRKGLAEETEHRIFNVASAVLIYAVQEGYLRTSPAAAVRRELRSAAQKSFQAHPLTREQAESIIGNIAEGRNRLFAQLALWTGFRAGELAGLRVRNIDRLRNVVQVDETVEDVGGKLQPGVPKTKRSRGRRVPIPKAVMDEVGAFIDAQRLKPDAYLFAARSEYFHYQNWRVRHWIPACRAAGFWHDGKPTVRPYDLRHTFASLRAAEGVPPHVLQAWMGHTTITTTMNIYTHVYDGDTRMEALVERLYGSGEDTDNVVKLEPADEA
ncbi:site-specific integrase [Nocardioides marinquilinus]|uniref:tyrosine-type recombinase/integrase n=1 Tax=Nocardioides marinquilinus TaxID=1210400 RepID=UPI0031EB84B5